MGSRQTSNAPREDEGSGVTHWDEFRVWEREHGGVPA